MTPYELGDVVLLRMFPFSNLDDSKRRPALVLADTGDQDVLVARITSENVRDSYDLKLDRWKEFGLLLPSCIRLSKMAALGKRLVLRKLGKIGSPERRKVRGLLKNLFDLP